MPHTPWRWIVGSAVGGAVLGGAVGWAMRRGPPTVGITRVGTGPIVMGNSVTVQGQVVGRPVPATTVWRWTAIPNAPLVVVFPQATLTGPVTTWTLDVPFGSSLTVVAQAFVNGQAIAIGSLTLPVESGVAPG